MPVESKLVGGKVRTVTAGTDTIEITDKGNPRDGGGWSNTPAGWAKANRQVGYMNEGASRAPSTVPNKAPLPGTKVPKARRSASPTKGPRLASPM